MTPHQINLINSSFAAIYFDRDEAAKAFYDRLFALAPDTRRLFKSDMESQGRKLMDTLALAVTSLRRPESLQYLLQDTAQRHVGYGAREEHYSVVGEALLWMLERRLGEEFTPELKSAWTELYTKVADTMKRIARDPVA